MHHGRRRTLVLVLAAVAVGLMAQAALAAAPTVTSVSPGVVQNTGSTQLHIVGTALDTVTDAVLTKAGQPSIVGTALTNLTSTDFDATFDLTNAGPGSWTVEVTSPDGTGTCGCFLIAADSPTVTAASPSSRGQGASAQDVTVTGQNIFKGAAVSFTPSTGITVNSTTWNAPTSITVNIDVAATATVGSRTVTVTNTDGDAGTFCAGCFSINAAPTATSAAPANRGQGAASQEITVIGTGFTGTPGVSFGTGITTNNVVRDSGTQLRATITIASDAPAGARSFTVTNPDQGVATCANCFTVNLGPGATAANPTSLGQGATGRTVVITGTNFSTALPTVSFGDGVTVTNVVRDSGTQLTATVSVAAGATPGSRNILVTNADAGGPATCSACFTVNAAPTATSATPSSRGQGATNQSIVVAGTGFATGLTATVSGTGVTVNTATVDNATQVTLSVTVSNAAATGARDITFTNPDFGVGTCSACFTVTTGPTLAAGGVSPSSRGQGATNQTVLLTGTGFDAAPSIAISGTGVTINSQTVLSSTQVSLNVSVGSGATTGARNITIANADGGTVVCTGCFTVNAAPTVSAAVANSAPNTSQTAPINITGTGFSTNFASAGSVLLRKAGQDDIPGTNLSWANASSVSARFQLSGVAPGTWSIVLVNGDGGGPATCNNCFTVTAASPALAAAGVSPSSRGVGATGVNVTLTGSGYWPGATVTFGTTGLGDTNGITVNSVTRNSSTQLVANITVASNATVGSRTVTVTNTDGQFVTCGPVPAVCFSIAAAPTATSVSPNPRLNNGSHLLTITGTGFDNASGSALLRRAGSPDILGTGYTFDNATTVKATFDLTGVAPGNWDMIVTNGNGGSATCTACLSIAGSAPPTVTSVAPDTLGQGAASTDLVITGTNFFIGATVTAGTGVTVEQVVRDSSTQLTATVSVSSSATLGVRDVRVTNTDLQFGTCGSCLTIASGPTLTSGGVDPASRPAGAQNQTIVLTGTDFAASPTVTFGDDITIDSVTLDSPTQITAVIDIASAVSGTRDITITNTDAGRVICSACFTITTAPSITSIDPTSLGQGASEQVVVTGGGFSGSLTATFSGTGVTVSDLVIDSPTQLTLAVDVGGTASPGARSLTVDATDGGTATLTDALTINAAPTLTDVSPSALGQGASSQTLTLTGTNFIATPDVTISGTGVSVDDITQVGATELSVVVSVDVAATPGAQDLTVVNDDGATPAVCTGCFTVNEAPTVTSANPGSRGQGAQSQSIELTGTGFLGTPGVVVSGTGVTVNSVTRDSGTQLTIDVDVADDAATTERDITVTNADQSTPAVCLNCFTVNAAPTLASIAPVSGTNDGPLVLTLTGTGFDDSTGTAELSRTGQTSIAGTSYAVSSSVEAEVSFDLTGAAPGDWDVVLVNGDGGGPAVCAACLEITAAEPTVTLVSPSELTRGAQGQAITVTGTNFFPGATVTSSNPSITVDSAQVVDATTIDAVVSIASDAATGVSNIVVRNTDEQADSCGCFTVRDPATVTLTYETALPLTGTLITATFSRDVGPIGASSFVLRETDTAGVGGTIACTTDGGLPTSCGGSRVHSATFSTTSVLVTRQSYTARVNPSGAETVLADGAPVTAASLPFQAGSTSQQQSSPAVSQRWDYVSTSSAYGGSYRRARLAGESATMTITGRVVSMYTMRGPDQGIVDLYVGSTRCRFDLYSSTRTFKVRRSCAAPTSGTYTVRIVPTGTKRSSSSSTLVSIDAIQLDWGTIDQTPSLTYLWDTRSSSGASGGSFIRENLGGSAVRFLFRGSSFRWYTAVGPSMGKVRVYVDGERVDTIDLYASTVSFRGFTHDCGAGCDEVHEVKIVPTGTKDKRSSGTYVIFDRFRVG